MRAGWLGAAIVLTVTACAMSGCELGSRRPSRDEVRPYDLVPQSGYLAEGPTDAADYAVPASAETSDEFDEAAYRAAIQKDLVRINALLTENERLRQELAATTIALTDARADIDTLGRRIAALEEKLAQTQEKLKQAEAKAARRSRSNEEPQ
jgi:chromosome segregation ATPase